MEPNEKSTRLKKGLVRRTMTALSLESVSLTSLVAPAFNPPPSFPPFAMTLWYPPAPIQCLTILLMSYSALDAVTELL